MHTLEDRYDFDAVGQSTEHGPLRCVFLQQKGKSYRVKGTILDLPHTVCMGICISDAGKVTLKHLDIGIR